MHLYLKAVQLKQLRSLARQTGAPVAVLIRRAIDQFLKRGKPQKTKASNGK